MLTRRYYGKYIKNTYRNESTPLKVSLLCTSDFVGEVYLSTRSLKHIFDRHIHDKKDPETFRVILNAMPDIIKRPDEVRLDTEAKRGNVLFIKRIDMKQFLVSVEIDQSGMAHVVSSSATGRKYIEKFTLLWSWETATPPSKRL
jgi:hypothetical protein